jgi:hypothetical protein
MEPRAAVQHLFLCYHRFICFISSMLSQRRIFNEDASNSETDDPRDSCAIVRYHSAADVRAANPGASARGRYANARAAHANTRTTDEHTGTADEHIGATDSHQHAATRRDSHQHAATRRDSHQYTGGYHGAPIGAAPTSNSRASNGDSFWHGSGRTLCRCRCTSA